MNTDPKAGFPTFGAAVRAQRIRTGLILTEPHIKRRKDDDPPPTISHAVSRITAERGARGLGTFTR